jgi:hypothetical protein
MRAAVGLAWRAAAMVAFGATAALAVTLNRPVPAPAALTAAARPQVAPTCAPAALTVSVNADARIVDFTNTSSSACTLSGYPQVAAYAIGHHGYEQVGNAALREAANAASRVLLRPGRTAHSDVGISGVISGVACKPVAAAGLRVVPPGAAKPRYLPTRLTVCSATGPDARIYLRVRAVQPGGGGAVNPKDVNLKVRRSRHPVDAGQSALVT